MYSGLFNSTNSSLQPGLFFNCYDDYMNDNVSFFNTAAPIATDKIVTGTTIYGATSQIPDINVGTNGCITNESTPDFFSIQWLGYFKPNVSSTWYFATTSDDCSYLWIGDVAQTGFTTANANVNNGGAHASNTVISGPISLTADVYYPLRIQFGELGGGNEIRVWFNSGTGWFTDGTGFYFHT